MTAPDRPAATERRGDALLAAAIFTAALAWFAVQPHNLGPADESYLLVEARRVAGGERLYRDVFWFAMPAAHWLLAAVFALWGASLTTAKLAVAVVNAGTAALAFATARGLGVRRGLALLPPLAFLALAQPTWPHVSPHWLGTLLIMALFLIVAPPRALERPRRLLAAGLALGALGAIHQQKAPVLAIGLAAAILLASWLRRAAPGPAWWSRLGLAAAGTLAVIGPLLAVLFATVDAQRLLDDTVRFPLTGYRPLNDASWGQIGLLNVGLAAYTWPRLLRDLPLLLPLGAAAAAAGCARGWPRWRVAQWSTALLIGASALVAIGYNADFIHIAFMAAPLFVLAALLLDGAIALLPPREQAAAGPLVAVALALLLGTQMARNAIRMRAEYAVATDTAFGRVDFHAPAEAAFSARVAELLDATPGRVLFVYPAYATLYLTAGGRNPTRHQLLVTGFNWPEHFAEVQAELEAQPAAVVAVLNGFVKPDDPFMDFVRQHFEVASEGQGWTIYQRRAAGQ